MKKSLFAVILFFCFMPVGFCADSQLFTFQRGEHYEQSSYSGDMDSINDFTYYLNWVNQPWFDGSTFWDLNGSIPFQPEQIRWSTTDYQGNVGFGTELVYPEYINIQLPHSQFCDINKDCRIDTILRFYDASGGASGNKDSCDARCISGFRDNWIITQTRETACTYKSGFNGNTSDIGISCYSPAGSELINIRFIQASKKYTTYNQWTNSHFRQIGIYLKWPTSVQGNNITDLDQGGYEFFNSDYRKLISNQNATLNGMHSNGTITNLLSLPITFLQRLVNSFNQNCSPVSIGTLWNTEIKFECVNLTTFSPILSIVDIFVSGFLAYRFGCKMVKLFNKFTSLKEGGLEDAYE